MNTTKIEIEKLKQGDADVWENLVSSTSPKLFALFGSMLGLPDSRVRELVSEVYVKAFKNIGNFRGDASIKTWLSVIATNLARDYVRKQSKQRTMVSLDETAEIAAKKSTPEFENKEILEILYQLPESYQRALTLYFIEQHKYEQIARIMNLPIGTVKTLLYRGKKMLRKKYIQKYGRFENER